MRNCIKLHITASDKTSSHSHTIISLDTARGLAQSSFADSWFSASHKMSANEKAPISNHGPVSQYGSLGADGSSHDGEAPGSEQSLTFHQVGYEVAEHCGRRTKTILTSCRWAVRKPSPSHLVSIHGFLLANTSSPLQRGDAAWTECSHGSHRQWQDHVILSSSPAGLIM